MIILVQEAQSLKVEESTESTATKPAENTQSQSLFSQSNATVEAENRSNRRFSLA